MKKSSKPLIVFSLLMILMLTAFGLAYVSLKLEYENLTKKKLEAENTLNFKEKIQFQLIAKYQEMNSKERIVKIAEDEFGMVPVNNFDLILKINQNDVQRVKDILKEKYE